MNVSYDQYFNTRFAGSWGDSTSALFLGTAAQNQIGSRALAIIRDIYINSPAEKGELLPGDVIVGIDGKRTLSLSDVLFELDNIKGSKRVEVYVLRTGNTKGIKVKIDNTTYPSANAKMWPGFSVDHNISVSFIEPNSLLKFNGLQTGDIITQINGDRVEADYSTWTGISITKIMKFYEIIGNAKKNKITLTVSRKSPEGRSSTIEVTGK
jgi:C-terminal processing protease CtpA/Prc